MGAEKAPFHLAVILALAAAETRMMGQALLAGTLGELGVLLGGLGVLAPTLVHLWQFDVEVCPDSRTATRDRVAVDL